MSIEQRFMKSPKGKRYLKKKIKENMKEWKKGRWVSQKQALAVSYSEARRYSHCKKNQTNARSRNRYRSKPSGKKT